MKIIALEEAFAIKGLKMVPTIADFPIPVDPSIMADWLVRDLDFEHYRLPEMDANGVSVQVLSLTAPGIQGVRDAAIALDDARIANDYLAGIVAKWPDRFRGFAALALHDPEAGAQELRRCVNELNFCGALVNDHTDGHYLDEPQFEPIWRALEELNVPLYIHPGAPPLDKWNVLEGYPELGLASWGWQAQVGGHTMRLIHSGLFDRHPKARVIIGHMGEFLPFQLWRFDSRYNTMNKFIKRLERMPSAYFGTNIFITTSGVCDPAALTGAVLALGEDAVLFSIDYPYESSESAVRFLKSTPLSASAREKIAHLNAERLLQIGDTDVHSPANDRRTKALAGTA